MIKYFRNHLEGKDSSETSYRAFGEPRTTEHGTDHPIAEMFVGHYPERFQKVWNTGKGTRHSEDTGLDHRYVQSLVRDRHPEAIAYTHSLDRHLFAEEQLENAKKQGLPTEPYEIRVSATAADRKATLNKFLATPEGSPDTLFNIVPEQHVVEGAYADPSMRLLIPLLGAMALQDINKDGGNKELTADSALSQFSSKLTQNAIARGFPIKANPKNKNAEARGQMSMTPRRMSAQQVEHTERTMPHTIMSPEQVTSASEYLRSFHRGEPIREIEDVPVNNPVFRRPMLPGM